MAPLRRDADTISVWMLFCLSFALPYMIFTGNGFVACLTSFGGDKPVACNFWWEYTPVAIPILNISRLTITKEKFNKGHDSDVKSGKLKEVR